MAHSCDLSGREFSSVAFEASLHHVSAMLEDEGRGVRIPLVVNASNNRIARMVVPPQMTGARAVASLTGLNLAHNRFTRIIGFEKLPLLQELNLSHCQLTSTWGLSENLELRTLRLAGNQVRFVEGLEPLAKLKELDVRGNLIRHAGAIRPLSLNCGLRVLCISGNPIDQDRGYHVRVRVLLPGVVLSGGDVQVTPSPSKLAVSKRSYHSMHVARHARDDVKVLASPSMNDTIALDDDITEPNKGPDPWSELPWRRPPDPMPGWWIAKAKRERGSSSSTTQASLPSNASPQIQVGSRPAARLRRDDG